MCSINKRIYEEHHKYIDSILYRLCNICNKWYELNNDNFYFSDKSKTKYSPYCKCCHRNKSKKYRQEHKEERIEYDKKDYRKNKKTKNKNAKKWYNNNKDRQRFITKRWQINNRKKVKEYGDKRKNKNHTITNKEWNSCKEYFNFECAYCGMTEELHKNTFKQRLHKEHLIDCGRGDLKNCLPSCKICNSEKHITSFNDWYNINNPKYSRERYLKIYQWVRYDCKNYINKKEDKHKTKEKENRQKPNNKNILDLTRVHNYI